MDSKWHQVLLLIADNEIRFSEIRTICSSVILGNSWATYRMSVLLYHFLILHLMFAIVSLQINKLQLFHVMSTLSLQNVAFEEVTENIRTDTKIACTINCFNNDECSFYIYHGSHCHLLRYHLHGTKFHTESNLIWAKTGEYVYTKDMALWLFLLSLPTHPSDET